MKRLVSALLLIALLQCAFASTVMLRKHDSISNKISKTIKSAQKSLFHNGDVDQETVDCVQDSAKTCQKLVKTQLKSQDSDHVKAYGNTLIAQGKTLKAWVGLQGDSLTSDQLVQYFDNNLINDPVTGQFWQCIENSYQGCIAQESQGEEDMEEEDSEDDEDDEDDITKKINNYLLDPYVQKHEKVVYKNDLEQNCAKEADSACGQQVQSWLSTLNDKDHQTALSLLNKQSSKLRNWVKRGKRSLTQVESYVMDKFYGSPTESIWQCDVQAWQNCMGKTASN